MNNRIVKYGNLYGKENWHDYHTVYRIFGLAPAVTAAFGMGGGHLTMVVVRCKG